MKLLTEEGVIERLGDRLEGAIDFDLVVVYNNAEHENILGRLLGLSESDDGTIIVAVDISDPDDGLYEVTQWVQIEANIL